METNFNFKSQICTTREQSERLLALGLKKETADCYYWQETEPMYGEAVGIWHLETLYSKDNQEHFEYLDENFGVCLDDDEEHYFIPAWSLQRLLSMFPTDAPKIYGILGEASICIRFNNGIDFFPHKGDIYEGVVKGIEWLIKEGYFNKEYLV